VKSAVLTILSIFLYSDLTLAQTTVFPVFTCKTQQGAVISIDIYRQGVNSFAIQADAVTNSIEEQYWAGGEISEVSYLQLKRLPAVLKNELLLPIVISATTTTSREVRFQFSSKLDKTLEIKISDAYRMLTLTDCKISKINN
jgi:hypothetical protein